MTCGAPKHHRRTVASRVGIPAGLAVVVLSLGASLAAQDATRAATPTSVPTPVPSPPPRAEAVPPELPDAALQADIVVLTRHVRRAGRMIAVKVERYLNGRGPDEIFVEDRSSEPPAIGVVADEPWVLFLFTTPEGLVVLAAAQENVVALAPDGTRSHAFPPRAAESLVDLVLALRACRHGDTASAARELAQSLLASGERDLQLVALQLAAHGLRSDPIAWTDAVALGAARAPAALTDEQPLLRRAARELLPALPPVVALVRLNVLLADPALSADVQAELLAAAVALQPDAGAAPDAATLHALLRGELRDLAVRDTPRIRAALASPDSLQQQLGTRWVAALVATDAAVPDLSVNEATERLAAWLAHPSP